MQPLAVCPRVNEPQVAASPTSRRFAHLQMLVDSVTTMSSATAARIASLRLPPIGAESGKGSNPNRRASGSIIGLRVDSEFVTIQAEEKRHYGANP